MNNTETFVFAEIVEQLCQVCNEKADEECNICCEWLNILMDGSIESPYL